MVVEESVLAFSIVTANLCLVGTKKDIYHTKRRYDSTLGNFRCEVLCTAFLVTKAVSELSFFVNY